VKALSALATGLNDRMNPLVLKELRQAVRSRFVAVVLMLFLAALLLIIGIYVMTSLNIQQDMSAGRDVFVMLQVALLATTLLFTAAYGGLRIAMETSQRNTDLLFITTIRPTSIIWGKFVSGLALTMMIFAAAAPFMVLTYLLRGIDVPTVLFILTIDVLAILVVMQASLLVGALPVGLVLNVVLGLVLLAGMVGVFALVTSWTTSTLYWGMGINFADPEFWAGFGSTAGAVFIGVGTLFFLTVACVSPPASNRALPTRIFLTVTWLITGIAMVWLWREEVVTESIMFVLIWGFISAGLFGLAMLFVAGERDTYGRRLRSGIPRNPLLRFIVFPFYTGAVNGVLWASAIAAISVGTAYFCLQLELEELGPGSFMHQEVAPVTAALIALPLYGFCYAMTGNLIRRLVGRGRLRTAFTGVFALALMALGAAVPPIVMFFVEPYAMQDETPYWMLLNPMAVGWFDSGGPAAAADYRQAALTVLGVWALLILCFNAPRLIQQLINFKPLRDTERHTSAAASPAASTETTTDAQSETATAHG
jgi:hypothetical protein